MKKNIVILLLFVSFCALAQKKTTTISDKAVIKESLKLGSRTINEISTDGDFSNPSDTEVPTALAVKTYVDNNNNNSGGGVFRNTVNVGQDLALNSFRNSVKTDTLHNIVFLGDSRTAAGHTTSKLIKELSALYNYSGAGYYNFGETICYGGQAHTSDGTSLDFSGNSYYSQSGRAYQLAANQKVEIQLLADSTGVTRGVDFYYLMLSAGGQIEVLIDNTIVATLNTNSSNTVVNKYTYQSATKFLNIKVRAKSTNTSNVVFLGMNLKKRSKGVTVHNIGNSGATTTQFSNILSYKFIKDVSPELVFIRLGVNGVTNTDPKNQKSALKIIIDSLRLNCSAGIVIVGEHENSLPVGDYDEEQLNRSYYSLAEELGVGYFSLREICYDWAGFRARGNADVGDNVHENQVGGNVFGQYFFDFIHSTKSSRESTVKNFYDTATGVSLNDKTGDGELLDITNSTPTQNVASFGYKGGGNSWFNLNTFGGTTDFTWFSKVANGTTNYVSTASILQRQIKVDGLGFYIRAPASTTSVGNNVAWSEQLKIAADGLISMPMGYSSTSSTALPGANFYGAFDNAGTLTKRTFAQVKADLAIDNVTGTYNPLVTNNSNVSFGGVQGAYSKVNSIVNFSIKLLATPTSINANFVLSLPVTSDLQSLFELTATGVLDGDIFVSPNLLTDKIEVTLKLDPSVLNQGQYISIVGQYLVR